MTIEQLNEMERVTQNSPSGIVAIERPIMSDLIRLARVGMRIEKWKENTLIPPAIAKETTDE